MSIAVIPAGSRKVLIWGAKANAPPGARLLVVAV
jgi:hypothetical protein